MWIVECFHDSFIKEAVRNFRWVLANQSCFRNLIK
jgi:hypothetical protein